MQLLSFDVNCANSWADVAACKHANLVNCIRQPLFNKLAQENIGKENRSNNYWWSVLQLHQLEYLSCSSLSLISLDDMVTLNGYLFLFLLYYFNSFFFHFFHLKILSKSAKPQSDKHKRHNHVEENWAYMHSAQISSNL